MPNKLKYTFDDYINNPSGKGSGVVSIPREMIRDSMATQLTSLESKKGKIKYTIVKSGDGKLYYIDFKIPSESTNNFYYDVVVEFSTKSIVSENTIKDYNVRFFANDPSFVFTYAYTFKTHGLLLSDLENKLPFRSLTQKAGTRNPDNTVGYVKNIYFAYLIMQRDGLFDKQNLNRLAKIGSLGIISKDIMAYDRHETERKNLNKKARDGLNPNPTLRHSSMLPSKGLSKSSSTPAITKKSSVTKTVSGSSKTVKRTKKI